MSKLTKTAIIAGLGVAAGTLLAPKSGKETRSDLKKKSSELKKRFEEKSEQVHKMANEVKEEMNKESKKTRRTTK